MTKRLLHILEGAITVCSAENGQMAQVYDRRRSVSSF